jgi:hypothetical protein
MKKGEHNGRTTERGFREPAAIIDTKGQTITLRESSQAGPPCLWIFTKPPKGEPAVHIGPPWQPVDGHPHILWPEPHLSVANAKRLRDALTRWIDAVEDEA